MSNLKTKNVDVVLQNPGLPDFLDFAFLRSEGLTHIGNFSGKIWTDHNTHDPGVTILEVLCYALLDLGYRTQLPIEELFALKPGQEEDNFLTPAEILTCNPVTITDYRKLLMEIDGVRNAWLEPLNQTEPLIYFDNNDCKLHCAREKPADTEAIRLNGLYRVLIELSDPDLVEPDPENPETCTYVKERKEEYNTIITNVQNCLSAHRNLCEDFEQIIVLCPQKIDICVDIDLAQGTDADNILLEITREMETFLSPIARFYSFQNLLEKNKTIEEIYGGRPYNLACLFPETTKEKNSGACSKTSVVQTLANNSHGFLDTEELEKIVRRKEIHLSDLYNVLHSIKGVESVRSLCFANYSGPDNDRWTLRIENGCVPRLGEASEIHLYTNGVRIPNRPAQNSVVGYNKTRLESNFLDPKIPYGVWRSDLDQFWSVQTELPRVYGVGETGLPDSASVLRQAQGQQLRAFLLFFDQLLADYLRQLARFRELYSRSPEKSRNNNRKHTFFAAGLNDISVPQFESLLRFGGNQGRPLTEGAVIMQVVDAAPLEIILCEIRRTMNDTLEVRSVCESPNAAKNAIDTKRFKSVSRRERVVETAIYDFANGRYSIEIVQDFSGYFFVIRPDSLRDLAFVSAEHFGNISDVNNAANSAAYWASLPENYRTYRSDTNSFDFDIVFKTADYEDFIQNLLENPRQYSTRRNAVLNHLMARFAERFSDYAAIAFGAVLESASTTAQNCCCQSTAADNDLERIIENKSDFLWNYPDLSRNRGKAFDYRQISWNRDNIAGYEKRVMALAGIANRTRHSLCNIEVLPKPQVYNIEFVAGSGERIFSSQKPVLSLALAQENAAILKDALRDPQKIQIGYDAKLNLFNYFIDSQNQRFVGSGAFKTRALAEQKVKALRNVFAGEFSPEINVIHTLTHFQQVISDTTGKVMYENPELMATEIAASTREAVDKLLIKAGKQLASSDFHMIDGSNVLDVGAWTTNSELIKTVPGRWKLEMPESGSNRKRTGGIYDEYSLAATDAAELLEEQDYLNHIQEAYHWQIPADSGIVWKSYRAYKDTQRAAVAWRQAREWGIQTANYHAAQNSQGKIVMELRNGKGSVIALSDAFEGKRWSPEQLAIQMAEKFRNAKTRPRFEQKNALWGFYLRDGSNSPLMESYAAYDTPAAAVTDFLNACAVAKIKGRYVPSGDAVNLDYKFILKGTDDRFLAESFGQLADESAVEKAIKACVQVFSRFQSPVRFLQLVPTYRFEVPAAGALMVGDKEYNTAETASKAIGTSLTTWYTTGNLVDAVWKLQTGVSEKTNAAAFRQVLDKAVRKIDVRPKPVKWRFQTQRLTDTGVVSPLWLSKKEFSNADRMEKDYAEFYRSLNDPKSPVVPGNLLKENQKIASLPAGGAKVLAEIKKAASEIAAVHQPAESVPANWVKPVFMSIQTGSDENTLDQTEFIYQYVKKGQVVAFQPAPLGSAPCNSRFSILSNPKNKFHTNLKEACQAKDALFNLNLQRSDFPDFCGSLQKVISLPTGENGLCKFHFVLSDLKEQRDCWVSFQGYDTRQEAFDALEEQFFELLRYAACREEYGKDGKIRTYWDFSARKGDCNPQNECLAVVAEDLINAYSSNEQGMIAFLCHLAALYPVFKENDNYYYQLTDPGDSTSTWPLLVGAEAFDNRNKAMLGFDYLLQLLAYPGNIAVTTVKTAGKNQFRVDIVEILAISAETYHDYNDNFGKKVKGEDQAWGRKANNDCAVPDKNECTGKDDEPSVSAMKCPKPEASTCYYGAEEFLFVVQQPGALYPVKEGSYYSYFVVKDCFVTPFEACWYDTPEERDKVMADPAKWPSPAIVSSSPPIPEEDCHCGQSRPEISYTCNNIIINEEKDKGGRWTRCWEQEIRNSLIQDAENRKAGLYNCNPLKVSESYPRFRVMPIQSGDCGPYSFQIVDTCCIIAKSPKCFSEASMRDAAMERLRVCTKEEGWHLLEHILLRPKLCQDSSDPDCREQNTCACLLPACPDLTCDEIKWPDEPATDACIKEGKAVKYVPFIDPYSFWVTLALPAWMGRFQEKTAKDLLEYMFRKEAPAHIALNIKWLSARQFCEFEAAFQAWLYTMECSTVTPQRDEHAINCSLILETQDGDTAADSAACKLAACLQQLSDFSLCCDQSSLEPKPCNCYPPLQEDKCEPFRLFDPDCCTPAQQNREKPGRESNGGMAWFATQMNDRLTTATATVAEIQDNTLREETRNRLVDNYLQSAGLVSQYTDHMKFIVANTGDGMLSGPLRDLAMAATLHTLDMAVQQASGRGAAENPPFDEKLFEKTLLSLTKKGLDMNELESKWPALTLSKTFGGRYVDRFSAMLKKL